MIWMAHIPQTSETRKHWDLLGKRAEEGPHTESRSVIGQCADGLFDFDLDCTVQRSARRALNGNHHRRRAGVLLHQCSCCVTGVQIESTVLQCQYCSMRSIRGESHLCSGWCKLSANSGCAAERWWSIIHSDAPPCWQWGSLWGRHTETNCWADWARTDTPPLRHYLLPLTAVCSTVLPLQAFWRSWIWFHTNSTGQQLTHTDTNTWTCSSILVRTPKTWTCADQGPDFVWVCEAFLYWWKILIGWRNANVTSAAWFFSY